MLRNPRGDPGGDEASCHVGTRASVEWGGVMVIITSQIDSFRASMRTSTYKGSPRANPTHLSVPLL